MEIALVFAVSMLVGGILELFYTYLHNLILKKPLRTNHHFTIGKRISIASLPIFGIIGLIIFRHYDYIKTMLIAAAIGSFLEMFVGQFFYRVYGVKIWTYHKGAINTFTSIYAIPYWAAAALVFTIIGKIIGI